jgi:DNA repair protein RecO
MENLESIVIKKSVYGEADYLVTFFTKEIGKVKGIARRAKKSKKRFGGRLEPFIYLNIDITLNEGKFNVVNDVNLIRPFPSIIESLEAFAYGSFVLEHVDLFTIENQKSKELFDATIKVFDRINTNNNILPSLLSFQLTLLDVNGIRPNFEEINSKEVKFDITNGNVYGLSENKKGDKFLNFHVDILRNEAYMDIYLGKVTENIKTLTRYLEIQSEKQFKTSKFLEELEL